MSHCERKNQKINLSFNIANQGGSLCARTLAHFHRNNQWVKEPINASDLYSFAGKVNGKRKNTLGLFVSMDGFSKECLQTTSPDLRSLILMDGMDLNAILTDRITLDDLLYRKRRHASEDWQHLPERE